MACKQKEHAALFLIVSLFTACILAAGFSGCSSTKNGDYSEDGLNHELSAAEQEPLPVLTLEERAALLDETWKKKRMVSAALNAEDAAVPLFTAPVALPAGDRLARKRGTALGGFLADAERGFLETNGIYTDFALINAELIRAGLAEGPVTMQDVKRVLPFGQKIVIAELSGSQLLDLLAFIGALPQGAGGFAQVSEGISYTLNFDETGFGSSISEVLAGGEPVDAERTYFVALNDFMAAGGNGYDFFLRDDVKKVQVDVELCEAIADYCSNCADSLYMKQGERITIQGGITE